jgi:uncharacterized protein YjbI with pentapeptide repeats
MQTGFEAGQMRDLQVSKLPKAATIFASFAHIALTVAMFAGPSRAELPPGFPPVETNMPSRIVAPAEAEKLAAEIAKTQAETRALRAIGDQTRWWTTVLAAVGSLIGAIVGGIFTFVVTKMGQNFSRLQKELEDGRSERDRLRREDDEKLSRLKMEQEQEQTQELHNLRLFQDLGHQSHRARLAAAAVLLDRLRKLRALRFTAVDPEASAPFAEQSALIAKVLVAVLKRQTKAAKESINEDADLAEASTAENEASLLKFIADEIVIVLGARFKKEDRPRAFYDSPLKKGQDFQKCDLGDVNWANVDARGIDFFQSDFSRASLRSAALQEAVFYEATLRDAALENADLQRANLGGCDLRRANLRNADLRFANLQGANLFEADIQNANFRDAVINTEVIQRFGPTVLPQNIEAPAGILTMNETYRPPKHECVSNVGREHEAVRRPTLR